MAFGALAPFPMRFGAADKRLKATLESVLDSLGTTYNVESTSLVWVKAYAAARALVAAKSQNNRLSYQFDPLRTTAFLPRWERIFGIVPPYGATDTERRAELSRRWARIGRFPKLGNVIKTLQEVLPNTFSSLVVQTSAESADALTTHTPTTLDLFPQGGVTVAGDDMWGSAVHFVAVKTTCPTSMLVGGVPGPDFYREVGGICPALDRMLPVWVTFDWFLDGPSGAGFFLDDPHNLDNERLRL